MTKAQAKSLAIRYNAYVQAYQSDDYNGVVVWGPMLEEIQQQTGVVMMSNIPTMVQIARRKMERKAA